MTLTEAIQELRRLSGKSQQFFATELNMSIRALQKYERGKTPEPLQLIAFIIEAQRVGRTDLEEVLGSAFAEMVLYKPGYRAKLTFEPKEKERKKK
jgi:transcriptional regulator with XRE-family HTH domain